MFEDLESLNLAVICREEIMVHSTDLPSTLIQKSRRSSPTQASLPTRKS